ncbi:hypothetical protein LJC33_02350 [Eubacteriales bacterium OttesenSCG-928-N13]|nr:hypothetical protein [Eubacteriales bacterium OttesenSCG-928-N13]
MKNVILSADGDSKVYSVPDEVADELDAYCMMFQKWLWKSPHAEGFRTDKGICYDETDFIDYLNKWIFPNQPSQLIENLGWLDDFDTGRPSNYKACPWYNF